MGIKGGHSRCLFSRSRPFVRSTPYVDESFYPLWEFKSDCVQWSEQDNEAQTYQEEDARLRDILWVGGAKLQLNAHEVFQKGCVTFHIHCIPRDGKSTESAHKDLKIEPFLMNGTPGLIIRYVDVANPTWEPHTIGDCGLVA